MFAVIGDPIKHSISPLLHETVYRRLGLHQIYEKRRVAPEALSAFALGMRGASPEHPAPDGVNVTLPHKAAIVPLLDEVRGDALFSGAVNTVVRESVENHAHLAQSIVVRKNTARQVSGIPGEVRLVGYNTDMEGLLRAIRAAGHEYAGQTVCVFGAGGAALGAAAKAAFEGAKAIYIVGRNAAKAERIVKQAEAAAAMAGKMPDISVFSTARTRDAAADADIFINATPLGMEGFGEDFEDMSFLEAFHSGTLVYDCVYTPAETRLVRAAKARGLAAETGLSMLIWQGLLSDALFLGNAGLCSASSEILSDEMYQAVYNVLKKELDTEL